MNPHVTERVIQEADSQSIPHQLAALGRAASNDANALQISRAGVATGLVAVPNRYMHSAVETISLDDIDHAADLLAAFGQFSNGGRGTADLIGQSIHAGNRLVDLFVGVSRLVGGFIHLAGNRTCVLCDVLSGG